MTTTNNHTDVRKNISLVYAKFLWWPVTCRRRSSCMQFFHGVTFAPLVTTLYMVCGYNCVTFHIGPTQRQFQIQNIIQATTRTSRVVCSSATVQNYLNFGTAAIAEATGTIRAVSWTMWVKKKRDYTKISKNRRDEMIEWLILPL